MIKHSKKAQRADLINWLNHVIDMNEPDLANGPTDMEIEIPVEIDDQTTWDLIETNIRDRGMRFKIDYTDKTEDNNYYYMYIWKQDNNLNSAVDASGNVTLTTPYYIWRLVYTCVFGYSERSSDIIYGDGKWDAELNSTIHKLESALHGTWDTLHINRDPDGEKMDFYLDTNTTPDVEAVTLTAKDNKSLPVTFTALECQVIYRCIEVMADQYADCYQFSTDDLDACYDIQKYIEDQLRMTGRQIIDATAFETEFDSSKRGAKMIKRANKLNSAADMFNEKAFDHYIKSLVDDCVEYASDCGDPVQIIEGMYPGYDWRWAAEGTDTEWEKARKELKNALYKYIKIQYLAYKE